MLVDHGSLDLWQSVVGTEFIPGLDKPTAHDAGHGSTSERPIYQTCYRFTAVCISARYRLGSVQEAAGDGPAHKLKSQPRVSPEIFSFVTQTLDGVEAGGVDGGD